MNRLNMQANDAAIQQNIFAEKLKILYRNLLLSIPGSFLCATIIFIGLSTKLTE